MLTEQASHSTMRGRSRVPQAAERVDRATLVSFLVGNDVLAAPVENVERVLRWSAPSPIPNLPPWLEGVIDHRGHMVPVIDLRKRLSRESRQPNAATRIVVFNTRPDWLAAVVDVVTEVLTVDAGRIVPPPPLVRGLSGEFLLGMVTHRDQVVLVLDVAKLLTSSETLSLHALQDANS
ncbi:MAG: chemotaxis protein CheW [Gemmatimonadaceae bacterium]